MPNKLRGAWTWFVEGLVEALLRVIDRAGRSAPMRLEMDDGEAAVVDASDRRIGRLAGRDGPARFEPPDLARRLSGAAIDVVIPPAWLFRRDLDPVAVASRPFLDAFVRHQIERITPWRVGDTHYRILERPMPDDPGRVAVSVALVPRRLVAGALAALAPVHPRSVRLRSSGDGAADWAIPLGGGRPKLAASLRRGVVWGLGATAFVLVGLVGFLQWQAGLVRDDIDEQDRVIAERKSVLARERRGADPGGEAAAKLRAMRDGRRTAVAVIDALSAAVPDSAHLTALSIDGDHVTIAGVTTDPSGLVPALETSGAFADVTFGSATTRSDAGGDRFSLEMKVLAPRSDHAGAPPLSASPPAGIAPVPSPVARAAP